MKVFVTLIIFGDAQACPVPQVAGGTSRGFLIKELRQKGGLGTERKIDEFYRAKYDLKQLGDTQVRAQRTKDGSLELADRTSVKRQAQEIECSKQQEKGRERGR